MKGIRYAVTTSHNQSPGLGQQAREVAAQLECDYIDRGERPLAELFSRWSLDGVVVVAVNKLSYVGQEGEFFFHPGLAGVRINRLNQGEADRMVEAMDLHPGDRVLDCTLGLGTDAIVAGHVVGPTGLVVGLEKSPVMAYLVKTGLSTYNGTDDSLNTAMERVQAVWGEHLDYLGRLGEKSFDVVYFDPMFRKPRLQSVALNPLRALAELDSIQVRAVELAMKVARKRVVLKERRGSAEFARLGFSSVLGGKYSPVGYGVIEGHDAT